MIEKMGKQCSGKMNLCSQYAHICRYKCCDQSQEKGEEIKLNNAILLYPGEYETAERNKDHIKILKEFNRGNLGYCDRLHFDQSKCSEELNFKPLDCKSYPFFPAIVGEQIVMLKDSACPIPIENGELKKHYEEILAVWKKLVEERPEVKEWINSLNLTQYGYVRYEPASL